MADERPAPMFQESTLAFPYKHSTGQTIGRFLAGLKEQRTIWGQRTADGAVVVPPLGYSETDGSAASEWVRVGPGGVVTAVAVVHEPIAGFHPSDLPFAYVLVRLDGADTALAHVVTDGLRDLRVGSRVEAVWAADDARHGTIRDIASFRVVG